jgi:hypothetical protein
MKTISYSQYSLWSNCNWAWKLKYVDGHRINDTTMHTIFGTSMHETIQEWLDILYNKSEKMASTMYLNDGFKEKLLALFKENITITESGEKMFLCDSPTLMQFYTQGCLILEYIQKNYKKIFPTADTKLHSIEYRLEIEVKPGVQYVGFIDIVTHNTVTNEYVLYDLKTSTKGWNEYQKKDPVKTGQLLLYKRFFSKQLGIPEKNINVEFIILKREVYENAQYFIPRVSRFEPANGIASVNKSYQMFNKFVDSCFDDNGDYIEEQKASPGNACRFCVYNTRKDLCPDGVSLLTSND